MATKLCPRCTRTLPLDQFSRDRTAASGWRSHCKACRAASSRSFYAGDRARQRERCNAWLAKHGEEKRASKRAAYARDPAKDLARKLRDPVKFHAQRLMANAINKGDLVPQPCVICGATKTEGHHEDYNKPLDVQWLCRLHHLRLHANQRVLGIELRLRNS